jgi:hypothetical protein
MSPGARGCISIGIFILAVVMWFLARREYREAVDLTGTAIVFIGLGLLLT